MKIKHSKFGLSENPVGLFVSLPYGGRTLLGEVKAIVGRDEVTGAIRLSVSHFNGEAWPVSPSSYAVDVIAQNP